MNICSLCSFENKNDAYFCHNCSQPLLLTSKNYFDLFSLPQAYKLNKQDLEDRLLKLQIIYHPDKYIKLFPEVRDIIFQNSAYINMAFKTLKDDMQRAKYIIELNNLNIDEASVPQTLLAESFEWRERLDEDPSAKELETLILEFNQKVSQEFKKLEEFMGKQLYIDGISVYIKLKFLIRFRDEVLKRIEATDETF